MPEVAASVDDWAAVLTAMESSIEDARAESSDPSATRHPSAQPLPVALGPLPADLEQRARAIVQAQREAISILEDRQQLTLRHLSALRSIPSGRNGDASAYLDISG